jgi:hypothetical protein
MPPFSKIADRTVGILSNVLSRQDEPTKKPYTPKKSPGRPLRSKNKSPTKMKMVKSPTKKKMVKSPTKKKMVKSPTKKKMSRSPKKTATRSPSLLNQVGYKNINTLTPAFRKKAITAAVNASGQHNTYCALQKIYKLHSNKNPFLANKLLEDLDYIENSDWLEE